MVGTVIVYVLHLNRSTVVDFITNNNSFFILANTKTVILSQGTLREFPVRVEMHKHRLFTM